MAENLYLRLAETGSAEDPVIYLEWMLLDETSGIVRFRGEGGLDDFRELSGDLSFSGSTQVMIPSEDVLLTQAIVPTKQPKQILQAVPYLVEEQLASDVKAATLPLVRDRIRAKSVLLLLIRIACPTGTASSKPWV